MIRYFNSIKVRLEHELTPSSVVRDDGFQFHKGTIRTRILGSRRTQQKLFQFHKGTIRTASSVIRTASAISFQFHKGTIRT